MTPEVLSVREWEQLIKKGTGIRVPIFLHTKSGSMSPTIRIGVDTVTVVPCRMEDLAIGDIIFVKYPDAVGYLLHRVIRIGCGEISTMGDNMQSFDAPIREDQLLGKVIRIEGPHKNMDCESYGERFLGRMRAKTIWMRPLYFLVRRVLSKGKRVLKGMFL